LFYLERRGCSVPTLKQILNIGMTREYKRWVLCGAIKQMKTIGFHYLGGYRTVEPYCLGIMMKGEAKNESLICYQTAGFSDMGKTEGWKLYRAADMDEIEVLQEGFAGDRPGYDPDELEMVRMICYVTPVKKAAEEIKETVISAEKPPEPVIAEPVMRQPVMPQPVINSLTHNELMARFRLAHPLPVPDLDTTIWLKPLVQPFPESAGLKIPPPAPVKSDAGRLVGQAA
jgi:hypothetical protein